MPRKHHNKNKKNKNTKKNTSTSVNNRIDNILKIIFKDPDNKDIPSSLKQPMTLIAQKILTNCLTLHDGKIAEMTMKVCLHNTLHNSNVNSLTLIYDEHGQFLASEIPIQRCEHIVIDTLNLKNPNDDHNHLNNNCNNNNPNTNFINDGNNFNSAKIDKKTQVPQHEVRSQFASALLYLYKDIDPSTVNDLVEQACINYNRARNENPNVPHEKAFEIVLMGLCECINLLAHNQGLGIVSVTQTITQTQTNNDNNATNNQNNQQDKESQKFNDKSADIPGQLDHNNDNDGSFLM